MRKATGENEKLFSVSLSTFYHHRLFLPFHTTSSYLLHGLQIGRQAAVAAKDLFVNDGSHRKAVEAVGERLPQLDVVAALALIVETIDAVDAGALVVATQ